MKKLFLFYLLLFLSENLFSQSDSVGVYYYSDSVLIRINPINSSGYRTNTLGTALTMGIAGAKMKVKFRGAQSGNKISEPIFVFYFNPSLNAGMMMDYFNFTNPSNINNFILVRLNKTRNGRELVWGKINAYSGANIGIKDEDIIQFKCELTGDNAYTVTPIKPLDIGEYAFVFDGTGGSGAFMPVFDFSKIE